MDSPNLGLIIAVLAPLIALQLGLTIIALVDLFKRDEAGIRYLPKWGWAVAIIFVNFFGAILYFLIGREDV